MDETEASSKYNPPPELANEDLPLTLNSFIKNMKLLMPDTKLTGTFDLTDIVKVSRIKNYTYKS
jgi:hypothetical protein